MSSSLSVNTQTMRQWHKRTPVQNATVFMLWLVTIAFVLWTLSLIHI